LAAQLSAQDDPSIPSAGMMRDDHGQRRTATNDGLMYALALLSVVVGLLAAALLMWNLI
jgi:hypothetical protein